jgi:TonB family protein
MRPLLSIALALAVACSSDASSDDAGSAPVTSEGFQPPVATNASPPFAYPPTLYADGVEGTVVLRLVVDEQGNLVPDSTTIAEGSGYPELDSAALAGVADLRFAPALQDGEPVSSVFLQPVHFRQPDDAP